MPKSEQLVISRQDFESLSSLITNFENNTVLLLEDELSRAMVVEQQQLPGDVVAMGSIVKYFDEVKKQETTVQLLYPHEMNNPSVHQKISVLAPIGAALIGLSVGQTIEWPLPNGTTKSIKVTSVLN